MKTGFSLTTLFAGVTLVATGCWVAVEFGPWGLPSAVLLIFGFLGYAFPSYRKTIFLIALCIAAPAAQHSVSMSHVLTKSQIQSLQRGMTIEEVDRLLGPPTESYRVGRLYWDYRIRTCTVRITFGDKDKVTSIAHNHHGAW